MSPRSEEFIEQARDRAKLAREVLASGHREGADYEAATPSEEDAQRYVDGATEFLEGVESMLAA
jgi:hypothetical protein